MKLGLYYLVLVASILLHEVGHILAALVLGVKIRKIGISWRGPYVQRDKSIYHWKNIAISFAGPAVNLLLAGALRHNIMFLQMNLIFGLGNLIPWPRHSDGGNILAQVREIRSEAVATI